MDSGLLVGASVAKAGERAFSLWPETRPTSVTSARRNLRGHISQRLRNTRGAQQGSGHLEIFAFGNTECSGRFQGHEHMHWTGVDHSVQEDLLRASQGGLRVSLHDLLCLRQHKIIRAIEHLPCAGSTSQEIPQINSPNPPASSTSR